MIFSFLTEEKIERKKKLLFSPFVFYCIKSERKINNIFVSWHKYYQTKILINEQNNFFHLVSQLQRKPLHMGHTNVFSILFLHSSKWGKTYQSTITYYVRKVGISNYLDYDVLFLKLWSVTYSTLFIFKLKLLCLLIFCFYWFC